MPSPTPPGASGFRKGSGHSPNCSTWIVPEWGPSSDGKTEASTRRREHTAAREQQAPGSRDPARVTLKPPSQQKRQRLRGRSHPVTDTAPSTCEMGTETVQGTEEETEAQALNRPPQSHTLGTSLQGGRWARALAGTPGLAEGSTVPLQLPLYLRPGRDTPRPESLMSGPGSWQKAQLHRAIPPHTHTHSPPSSGSPASPGLGLSRCQHDTE